MSKKSSEKYWTSKHSLTCVICFLKHSAVFSWHETWDWSGCAGSFYPMCHLKINMYCTTSSKKAIASLNLSLIETLETQNVAREPWWSAWSSEHTQWAPAPCWTMASHTRLPISQGCDPQPFTAHWLYKKFWKWLHHSGRRSCRGNCLCWWLEELLYPGLCNPKQSPKKAVPAGSLLCCSHSYISIVHYLTVYIIFIWIQLYKIKTPC